MTWTVVVPEKQRATSVAFPSAAVAFPSAATASLHVAGPQRLVKPVIFVYDCSEQQVGIKSL